MNRREFIMAGLGASVLGARSAVAAETGSFSFLQATDLHMTENPDIERGALQMKDKFMGRCFIDAVNDLARRDPGVAFIALTGDLTSGVDMNPACWPFAEFKWRHFRRYVTSRLSVPCRQLIGNNDCAATPYKTVFPECPLYWSFERGDILFVGLHGYNCWKVENTNHAGIRYDAAQLDWLKTRIRVSGARSLVLFTHEPLLCEDSHVARAQLAPILTVFRGEEIWNVAGHEHRNHTATFTLGGRLVRSVETMTPVGEWKVGKGCFRRFRCAGGRIVGSELHWTDVDGTPLEVTEDVTTRDAKPIALLEDAFAGRALSVRLVGRDPFELTDETARIENRISNYYVCRPDPTTHAPGRLAFVVPRAVAGTPVRSVVLLTGIGEKTYALPPVDQNGRTVIRFENASTREIKFFGYALCP